MSGWVDMEGAKREMGEFYRRERIAYDAACDINNHFELGLSDAELKWLMRRIRRAAGEKL